MRAVNLVPGDFRRHGSPASAVGRLGVAHMLVAALAIALLFVTVYVLSSNSISSRTAQLATVRQQVAQAQAEAARLTDYAKFEQLAQERAQTVREIAAQRFDWHAALSDLSRVMPANASLQSLVATVGPGVAAGGASGVGGSSAVRGDIDAPAFVLKGCTATQDDVAQLVSRLRLINGVTRVTLEDSATPGASQSTGAVSTVGSSGGCGNGPTFDMVVFFQPLAGQATISGASDDTP